MRVLVVGVSTTLLLGAQAFVLPAQQCHNLPHHAGDGAITPLNRGSRRSPSTTTSLATSTITRRNQGTLWPLRQAQDPENTPYVEASLLQSHDVMTMVSPVPNYWGGDCH